MNYAPAPPARRAAGALAAFLITAAMLWVLSPHRQAWRVEPVPVSILMPVAAPAVAAARPQAANEPARVRRPVERAVASPLRAAQRGPAAPPQLAAQRPVAVQAAEPEGSAPPATPSPALPSEAAASAPLRLDPASLRRAFAGSEGAVRKMARNSGTELDTRRPTQSEKLATAVAETARPDCLAPNAGGNLLSVFVIAYGVLADKCK